MKEFPNEYPLKDRQFVFPDEKYVADGEVMTPLFKMTVGRWKALNGFKEITTYDFVGRQRVKEGLA